MPSILQQNAVYPLNYRPLPATDAFGIQDGPRASARLGDSANPAQGWQGRWGALTSAPRPPGKISAQPPAPPSAPCPRLTIPT